MNRAEAAKALLPDFAKALNADVSDDIKKKSQVISTFLKGIRSATGFGSVHAVYLPKTNGDLDIAEPPTGVFFSSGQAETWTNRLIENGGPGYFIFGYDGYGFSVEFKAP